LKKKFINKVFLQFLFLFFAEAALLTIGQLALFTISRPALRGMPECPIGQSAPGSEQCPKGHESASEVSLSLSTWPRSGFRNKGVDKSEILHLY